MKPKTVSDQDEGDEGPPATTTTKTIKPGTTTPGFPTGYQVLTVPRRRRVVITCDAQTAVVVPGPRGTSPAAGVTYYYLFKHGVYPGDSRARTRR